MKTLLKILSTVAFALVLFVPAKNAFSAEFPAGESFQHIVGKVLEPHAADKAVTTLDSVNFNFWTKYVKICMWPESAQSYFRMGTTISNTIALQQADTTKMIIPAGTSSIFINGDGASFDFGALPMRAAVSTDGTTAPQLSTQTTCITEPWRTRGVVMHIASGLATADVWGYR